MWCFDREDRYSSCKFDKNWMILFFRVMELTGCFSDSHDLEEALFSFPVNRSQVVTHPTFSDMMTKHVGTESLSHSEAACVWNTISNDPVPGASAGECSECIFVDYNHTIPAYSCMGSLLPIIFMYKHGRVKLFLISSRS